MNCVGNVYGRVIEQPENDIVLRSNLADLRLVKAESFNVTDLVYDEANFTPGETYIMDWSLEVIDLENDGKAVLAFIDRAGNDTTITIDYQRTKFSIKNRIENWGLVSPNDSANYRDFKLVNESAKAVVVDTLLLLSTEKGKNWAYNGFKLDSSIYKEFGGVLPGYSIQPGEEISFSVSFDPRTVSKEIESGKNQFLDSIGVKAHWSDEVNSYCYFKYRAAVKSVTGSPCITVDKLDFAQVTVNDKQYLPFTIFNHGTSELTITGYTLRGGAPGEIYVSEDLGEVTPSNPINIAAGGSKIFSISFKPNAEGKFTEQIDFISNADIACSTHDPVLELDGEGIELTITPFTDLYIDENTSANIPFSTNNTSSATLDFIKESDDETLIPVDSMVIIDSGKNYNLKISPMLNKTGFCFLTITATNGVASASAKFKVTVSKVGLVEDNTIADNDITITPNPVKSNFSITSATLIIQEVMIYDISGAVVLQTENLQNIDISNFTAGIYYCVVKSNGNRYSKKFEIVR
jgi:hypothetical protein